MESWSTDLEIALGFAGNKYGTADTQIEELAEVEELGEPTHILMHDVVPAAYILGMGDQNNRRNPSASIGEGEEAEIVVLGSRRPIDQLSNDFLKDFERSREESDNAVNFVINEEDLIEYLSSRGYRGSDRDSDEDVERTMVAAMPERPRPPERDVPLIIPEPEEDLTPSISEEPFVQDYRELLLGGEVVPEAAAPPVREFTAEELGLPEGAAAPPPRPLTPEQSAQREAAWAETLSAQGIAEVEGVDIDKVAQSAEEWNAFNRAQEDSAARLAKVSEFLQERYPDKSWEQWVDKGYDLGRLSPDEITDLMSKVWSMDVEFEGGIQKVRLADGTEREVRMTVTPRAGGSSFVQTADFDPSKPFEADIQYDADGTVDIGSLGHFERRYYDVETGELLGNQRTGNYDRSINVNAETGEFTVYHQYLRNDEPIQVGEPDADDWTFQGPPPVGGGLAKELNYPAYAYYQSLTGDAKVEIGAAYSGRWIWPRQGAVAPIDGSTKKEAAFARLTDIASSPVFSGGRAGPDGRSQKPSERLAAALIAPTPEHRSRYEALGDLRERGTVIDTRDVQLAIEAPVDGFDVDSGAMIDVSRNSMIDQSGFLEMSDGMIDVLRQSDANINGQSFSGYWDSMSPENQAKLAADIVADLNSLFKDLGMGTSQTPIDRLVDTGVR
jgi:hypothetical protein